MGSVCPKGRPKTLLQWQVLPYCRHLHSERLPLRILLPVGIFAADSMPQRDLLPSRLEQAHHMQQGRVP